MSKPYSILTKLRPEAYLNPDNFVTTYDTINPGQAAEQYAKGLEISRSAVSVGIACTGTWTARMPSGVTTSSEGIGYHAHTASLLRGFLDGPAPLVVYRWDGHPGGTEIKPAAPGHEHTSWHADGGIETYR
jgi:hypothetical protein